MQVKAREFLNKAANRTTAVNVVGIRWHSLRKIRSYILKSAVDKITNSRFDQAYIISVG